MYIFFKVCLEYPQNIEEIKRSNDKKNTAQWKFSGDKHKSAHPINLGGQPRPAWKAIHIGFADVGNRGQA